MKVYEDLFNENKDGDTPDLQKRECQRSNKLVSGVCSPDIKRHTTTGYSPPRAQTPFDSASFSKRMQVFFKRRRRILS
jgi:hypothetical protein